MSDPATIARDNAVSCEAKKHAYRQTQDGVVVSFVLHPQEVPEGLATARLGTRYMLALVEIGDDERPVETNNRLVQKAGILCNDELFWKFMEGKFPLDWNQQYGESADVTAAILRDHLNIKSRKELATNPVAARAFENLAGEFSAWRRGE